MARVVAVFLPRWPSDRLRRQAGDAVSSSDAPLVLAGRAGSRRVVTAADAVAQALGLRADRPVSRRKALVRGLVLEPADAASLERLALWVLQHLSPRVAVDPPDGTLIDSTRADQPAV